MASCWKREEAKKKAEARKGLSEDEVAALDLKESQQADFDKKVRSFHGTLFPEEYDYMLDERVDISNRQAGVNPMSSEYQEVVSKRRAEMGFKTLESDGMALGDETLSFIRKTLENHGPEPLIELIKKYKLGVGARE